MKRSSKSTPALPRGVRRIFRLPTNRERSSREAADEVRVHFEMSIAELEASGLDADAARAEAVRRFGDPDEYFAYATRRAARKSRWNQIADWFQEWMQDIHFANRQFRKHPGFTALALLTLALGIGANTAIFTVVHRLLISPLAYPDGNRIVMLTMEHDDHSRSMVSPAAVRAWHARAHSFESIAAVTVDAIFLQDATQQDTIRAYITPSFLDVLGVHPIIGRGLLPADAAPGAAHVAMITYGLWQRAYGGRADVIGTKLSSADTSYTIVGVTPPGMGIPMALPTRFNANLHEATPSIWIPSSIDSSGMDVFARLRPGVSAAQASKELQQIVDADPSLQPQETGLGPPSRDKCCVRAVRAQDLVDPREVHAVEVLFVAVGFLLLIACANVANLLMSRTWARRREFAVRAALGAGKARIARLVLTESVTLAVAAGLVGIALAWQLLHVIVALRPASLANLDGVRVEPAVLLWSVVVSVATGILFGSAPALLAGGGFVGDLLRREARNSSGDRGSRRLRAALIVGEIALSLVLLAGAGLLVRSFIDLEREPLGFDPHALIAFDLLMGRGNTTRLEKAEMHKPMLDRVRATPGVIAAASGMLPGQPYHMMGTTFSSDPDASGNTRSISSDFGVNFLSSEYFSVTRMSLEGRAPENPIDEMLACAARTGCRPDAAGIDGLPLGEVVVSRSFAHRLWPKGSALGQQITSTQRGQVNARYRVVGVVDDVRIPGRAIEPQLYYRPIPGEIPIVARVGASPQEMVKTLRRVITATNARVVIQTALVGDDYIREALAPVKFAMALLGAFSVVALLLSAAGLYGVIAYSVTQRTREIGVRVALGAAPRNIIQLVVGNGLGLAAIGVGIGTLAAIAATRTLQGMLYGVTPGDPVTLVAIAALVATIALVASYVPARRALKIDPTEALRAD